MHKTSDALRQSRRGFLKQVSVAGGVLGAGISLEAGAQAPEPQTRSAKQAGRPGYRETDHVRKYYEKASL